MPGSGIRLPSIYELMPDFLNHLYKLVLLSVGFEEFQCSTLRSVLSSLILVLVSSNIFTVLFCPQNCNVKNFKNTEKLKESYNEYPYVLNI